MFFALSILGEDRGGTASATDGLSQLMGWTPPPFFLLAHAVRS